MIRNLSAAALTRSLNKLTAGLSVKIKSNLSFKQSSITGEIEQLMRARSMLINDPRFITTEIKTYAAMPATLYVEFNK